MDNFQTDWLAKWALYTPGRMFIREHNRDIQWTYSDFNQRCKWLAADLKNNFDIKKNDRIAIYSKNRAEYILFFLSAVKLGAILVPLNFRLTPAELDVQIKDAEPALFVYEKEYKTNVDELKSQNSVKYKVVLEDFTKFLTSEIQPFEQIDKPKLIEDDIAIILYTSGTTGVPKGAIINYKMLFWNAINTGLRLDLNSTDHTQSFAPFFHTGGLNVLFTPFLLHGASHTLLTKFDADLILQLMESEKATILFGVPTMLQMMADSPFFDKCNLSTVRYAIVGGAPMPIPLISKWHEKGIFIRQGYGLTEVGPNCFSLHQNDAVRKQGSIGFPNFYIDAKIVSETGEELGNNKVGELLLKSPAVTPGYWKNPKETNESITDGYFHTGDMVTRDDDGYFYVVDRKKNMFISGGENVYPMEIENALYSHPSIKEAAVIGIEDEKWGEVGKAYLVLNEKCSLTTEEAIKFCNTKLARYKIPKYFMFMDDLPKNDAGKIDKKLLTQIHKSLINKKDLI